MINWAGNPDYFDPVRFFNRTFLTEGLRQLAGDVVGRLTGQGDGDAVMQIQTPFGGGNRPLDSNDEPGSRGLRRASLGEN